MHLSLNKNSKQAVACIFFLLGLSNCTALKQEKNEFNSRQSENITSQNSVVSVNDLSGNWIITSEANSKIAELFIMPADTSYLCSSGPCFLAKNMDGEIFKEKGNLLGVISHKKENDFFLTFLLQKGWNLSEETVHILNYSGESFTLAGDHGNEAVGKMTRTATFVPSSESLPKIFPSCPIQLDKSQPSSAKLQERKCTYKTFFYMKQNGIKRALNDLLFIGMICAPEFTQALFDRAASEKNKEITDWGSVEKALAEQFDSAPWLDILTPEYRKMGAKNVSCCQSGDC